MSILSGRAGKFARAAAVVLAVGGVVVGASGCSQTGPKVPRSTPEQLDALALQMEADKNFYNKTGSFPPELNERVCDKLDQRTSFSSNAGMLVGAGGSGAVAALSGASPLVVAAAILGGGGAGALVDHFRGNAGLRELAEDCSRFVALAKHTGAITVPGTITIQPGGRYGDGGGFSAPYGTRPVCTSSGCRQVPKSAPPAWMNRGLRLDRLFY